LTATALPDVDDVIAELSALGSEENRAGMARFGINVEKAFGARTAPHGPQSQSRRN
jgi:hypothetical protein